MSFEEWKEVRLGDVVTLKRGYDLPKKDRKIGEYPIIASNGVTDFHESFKVKGPGVTTGRSGTLGEVYYQEGDFWPLNTTLYAYDFHDNDRRFIYYLLKTLNLSNYNAGSSVPTLNRNHIHSLTLKIPQVREQQKISEILFRLEKKVDLNNQINQKLEEMAQAIFRSWFIDFEPFQEAEFVDSELGRIPKGWEVGKLSDFVQLNPREILRKKTIATYIDMASLPTSSARINNINLRGFNSGTKFRQGDVLFARITPCLENGKTAIVDFLDSDEVGWGSTEFIVMRGTETDMMEFLYFLVRGKNFRSFAMKNMTGTSGRQRVSADSLGNYSLAIPPINKIKDYIELVRPFFLKMKENDKQSQTLANLRDTLLPKLMSGELRIPSEPIEGGVTV
ncbi:restriction endonuclease subunit S [Shimazuella kribbensis]|uniref:restriction endonuclease subunit S n=1 Tax=Shimazuella kribbensis TaxID=139808 RepID=UPI0004215DEB|nr:restriction endonuclease subunit S [Shimazuella kribbensis]